LIPPHGPTIRKSRNSTIRNTINIIAQLNAPSSWLFSDEIPFSTADGLMKNGDHTHRQQGAERENDWIDLFAELVEHARSGVAHQAPRDGDDYLSHLASVDQVPCHVLAWAVNRECTQ